MPGRLERICETAAEEGGRIELAGCYHEVAGEYAFVPCGYYPLLAGLARTQRMSQVLDIGTRYGGSILAVRKGLAHDIPERPVLVTVDLIEEPGHGLLAYPEIIRSLGDAAAPAIVEPVVASFRTPIDMLYLDAVHTEAHTRACFDAYTRRLNPGFVVVDDIYFNDSMKRLWQQLLREFPAEQVFDATELVGRGFECGFGVIEYRRA
jgi:cephalosporin hydroxylase